MLLLLASWLAALAASVTVGAAVVGRLALPPVERALVAAWIGLGTLGTVLLGASLLVPLSALTCAGITAALVALALAQRHTRALLAALPGALSRRAVLVFALAALAAASTAAQEPTLYDTGNYHYQAVLWLRAHGSVTGAALFSTYLGYSSWWFPLGALADALAPYRMVGFGGGLALLLFSSHALVAASRALRDEARLPDWFLLAAAVIALPRLYGAVQIQSLAPDNAVLVLTFLVLWALLLDAPVLAVLLAAFAVTAKLAAVPLLAVALLFAATRLGRRALAPVAAAALIVLPWVAVTFTTSGCLAHPVALTCFDVPTGVGASDAAAIGHIVRDYARWEGPVPPDATAVSWILPWIERDPGRAALVAMTLLTSLWLLVRRRDLGWPLAAALAVVASLLVMGPAPRFGLAAFLAPPALLAATLAERRPAAFAAAAAYAALLHLTGERIALGVAMLVALAAAVVFARRRVVAAVLVIVALDVAAIHARAYQSRRYSPHLLAPAPIRTEVALRQLRSHDFTYTRNADPTDERCYGSPIPCAPWALRHDVSLRRPERGIAGGFVRH